MYARNAVMCTRVKRNYESILKLEQTTRSTSFKWILRRSTSTNIPYVNTKFKSKRNLATNHSSSNLHANKSTKGRTLQIPYSMHWKRSHKFQTRRFKSARLQKFRRIFCEYRLCKNHKTERGSNWIRPINLPRASSWSEVRVGPRKLLAGPEIR